jgi:adenine deaminase
MPSCVPSAPGFETPGASIGPVEVTEAMTWPGIIGLGEMMNFPGVFNGDAKMLAEMAATHTANKTVGGHYASPDLGLPFHGYVAGGAEDDHEGTRIEDAVERVRQGMKPMLRYGSAWHDVASQVGAITRKGIDSHRFILCTDDSHVQTLAYDGHMDRVLRHAIEQGLEPMTAIQMMTINAAEHFGLTRELGLIAPGRWADLVLADDLKNFKAEVVIAKGRVIAEKGKWKVDLPEIKFPSWVINSVHINKRLKAGDFSLKAPGSFIAKIKNGQVIKVKANVIGVIENQAPTRHLVMDLAVEADGQVRPDQSRDVAKLALIQRHKGASGIKIGLVTGFGITGKCAVASTVAHDSHNLIIVGTDESEMAAAANKLMEVGGGQVVVKDGRVIGLVELEIAGLMSSDRADVVAKKAETVLAGFRTCGCDLNNPNMQLSLLALVVIPELRLSDKGLVDVTKFEFIPVLEKVN